MIGQSFGRWLVIGEAERDKNRRYWLCKCSCGVIKKVDGQNLKSGKSKSCGCLLHENSGPEVRHALSTTKIYWVWSGMKQRCYNPKATGYTNYGARGIKVCDEWKDEPDAFFRWAFNSGYAENLSIDRIDNNGDYEPNNCRWVGPGIQANNTRASNRELTFNGVTKSFKEWTIVIGISTRTLHDRLQNNWSEEDIVKPRNYRRK